ncbi:hypothetical protein [Streptomyces lushanensis]|uniref:hypothetical protein n=1 Tax=Streptomyces lushanensis TaxID=1434255 RepID=UPI0008316423|nr:hypothetical protein [Streptomyces lushanensis]
MLANKRSVAFIGIASVASLLVTGCSVDHAAPDGPPSSGAQPKGSALRPSVNLRLPVEEYLFSDSEIKAVLQAQRTLVQQCMRRFGVSHDFGSPGPSTGPRSLMDRRYGVTDEQMARSYGYHLGDRDPRAHPVTQSSPPTGKAYTVLTGKTESATDKETPALASSDVPSVNGMRVSADGCVGEATKKIAGSGHVGSGDLAQDLNGQSFNITKANPDVTRAFRSWSRCMKDKGFSYPDPFAAMADNRFQGKEPVPAEIQVATADVGCKGQVDLVDVWFTAETSLQRSLIKKNKSALDAAIKNKESQLATASRINRAE